MNNQTARTLLSGTRVLDFGRVISGPFVGQLLADLGAEVIKIERPPGGDETRSYGTTGKAGQSTLFETLNRNKHSLAIDFGREGAQQVLHKLIESCDVLIHNFRPGVMERLGLTAEQVWRINPRVVYCAISGFGSRGPLAKKPANDVIAQAFAGLMSFTGDAAGPPVRVPIPIADYTAGLFATVGILGGLLERERTGRGSQVETSLLEAMLALECMHIGDHLATGKLPRRLASGNLLGQPNQAFPTKDGSVVIAAVNDDMWRRCARALSGEELASDPRFRSGADRLARKDELAGIIEHLTERLTTDECVAVLDEAGVVCSAINDLSQVSRHPQVKELGILRQHGSQQLSLVASPLSIDGVRPPIRRNAPALGQDADAILRTLGLSAAQIETLRSDGVVTSAASNAPKVG
jgi:crotonobetainyl-CoA:carnitine CoA-transferase CaiB-like acyl-CoA transferase